MSAEIVTKTIEEGAVPPSPGSGFRAKDEAAYVEFKVRHSRVDPEIFMRVEQIALVLDKATEELPVSQRQAIITAVITAIIRRQDARVTSVAFGLLAEYWVHGDMILKALDEL